MMMMTNKPPSKLEWHEHVFVLLREGVTIKGTHLHVYECSFDGCGMLDFKEENATNTTHRKECGTCGNAMFAHVDCFECEHCGRLD